MTQSKSDWISTGCAVRIPLALLAILLSPLLISVVAARKLFSLPRLELAK